MAGRRVSKDASSSSGSSCSRWLLVRLKKDCDPCSCSTDVAAKDVIVGDRRAVRRLLDSSDQEHPSFRKDSRKNVAESSDSPPGAEAHIEQRFSVDPAGEARASQDKAATASDPVCVLFQRDLKDATKSADPKSAPAVIDCASQDRRRHQKRRPNIIQVQWAFTKVTTFSDSTRVYEVRQPSEEQPRATSVGDHTHGYFVTVPSLRRRRRILQQLPDEHGDHEENHCLCTLEEMK